MSELFKVSRDEFNARSVRVIEPGFKDSKDLSRSKARDFCFFFGVSTGFFRV